MLVNYFPRGMTPRELQTKAFSELESALRSPQKHVVLRAPTGSGKSAIAATVARFFNSQGGAYILCSRKYLQEQYLRDFSSMMSNFWGKSNYTCPIINSSCIGCPADKTKSKADYNMYLRNRCTTTKLGDKCPYIRAKQVAIESPVALLNFESFVANNLYGREWPERGVIIVDEAHNFVDRLSEQLAVPLPQDSRPPMSLTQGYILKLSKHYEQAIVLRNDTGQTSAKEVLYRTLLQNNPDSEQWCIQKEDDGAGKLVLYKLKDSIEEYLSRLAKKVIWMSASITNSQCMEMGLSAKNSVIVDMPSEFESSDHPIGFKKPLAIPKPWAERRDASKAAAANKQYQAIRKELTDILGKYERGIVHTHSYALAKAINRYMGTSLPRETSRRIAFHIKAADTDTLVKEFTEKKYDWIVTPTLGEGFDGAGDIVQAQVILKAPWPSLASAKMKRLLKTPFGTKLYQARALSALIQAYGRGSRYKGDTCVTYLLDQDLGRVVSGDWKDMPAWFRRVLEANGFWEER